MTDEAKALVERATRRASILHASAAWGSDEDGFLIDRLLDLIETQAREIERLRGALDNIANESSDTWARDWATAALGIRT